MASSCHARRDICGAGIGGSLRVCTERNEHWVALYPERRPVSIDGNSHARRSSASCCPSRAFHQRDCLGYTSLDGPDQLKERLAGLHWRWIPYAASGLPLAREIEKAVAPAPETDVLILGNHGLVVCGPDCHTAETLLWDVERRLAIIPRRFPKPDATVLAMIARFSRWQFPDVDSLHALGTDAVSRKILKGGVLYPCQAIFLGPTMPLLPPALVLSKFIKHLNVNDRAPPFVAVERSGVMLSEKMTRAEHATLIGLVQVTQRTEESVRLRYLKGAEVIDLLSKGAHGLQRSSCYGGEGEFSGAGHH
jgi:hypothetical protein